MAPRSSGSTSSLMHETLSELWQARQIVCAENATPRMMPVTGFLPMSPGGRWLPAVAIAEALRSEPLLLVLATMLLP